MPKVVIHSIENGPNLVMIDGKASVAFCRCGHSQKKPFCDGSHRSAEFRGAGAQTTILE
jgi:CDGSH-type Zn-finger protein